MMREKPILFSGAMVRAILDGSKVVTRRVCPVQPVLVDGLWSAIYPWGEGGHGADETEAELREEYDRLMLAHCPYGKRPGEHLWARETWGLRRHHDATDWNRASIKGVRCSGGEWALDYRADWGPNQEACFWRPSIHMPRWASRITLEVTGIAVERLQDITEEQANAEGVAAMRCRSCVDGMNGFGTQCQACQGDGNEHGARELFAGLWDSINGKRPRCSWADNPWVWAVSFRRFADAAPPLPPALRHMDGCCE